MVERLRELMAQGTPRPWRAFGTNVLVGDGTVDLASYVSEENAELICAAVNSLDALLYTAEMLKDLLTVAERIRGGDPALNPEEWYVVRDGARIALARLNEHQGD